MKISRELKTGIIALLTIGMFIWGFSFLKGNDLFNSSRNFYVEYGNVQGLTVSAPVTINGLKVGAVKQIYFHPSKKGILVVNFSLDSDYSFSKKSIAEIYSPDFISGKSIKIIPLYGGDNAISGDTLKGNIETGILGSLNDQVGPLQNKVESFLTNADNLLQGFNVIVDDEGQANLKNSIASLNTVLSTFKTASRSLNSMLAKNGKLDSVFTNATTITSNLVNLTDSLNSANLKQTVKKLETTLNKFNGILSDVEDGKGSIGKLLKDEGFYDNLEGAAKEMEALLKDLKEHPKRFVHFSLFGKKAKPYTEDEIEK
jgi:phospholipid/cholesterol/gamma-HCH transport system substrate-binding protein